MLSIRISRAITTPPLAKPRARIRTYATGPPTHMITLPDGRTLAYTEYGNPKGKPLFYLHGFPSSRLEGSGFEALAYKHNIRFLTPDRPGFGLSSPQPNRQIIDYPADIASLADHLGLGRFSIIGASGGGPYALACAHAFPERLSAVGLLASAGPWAAGSHYISTARKTFSLAATYTPWILTLIMNGLLNTLKLLDRWIMALERAQAELEGVQASGPPREVRRRIMLQKLTEGFAQGAGPMVQEVSLLDGDWGFRFEDVRYDKLWIWHGSKDENVPLGMIEYMAGRLPHAELRVFEGDTHFTIARHMNGILGGLYGRKYANVVKVRR